MTNLTDDWKAGELEYDKYYFCQTKEGVYTFYYGSGSFFTGAGHYIPDYNIQEVLAPCSYEHLQELEKEVLLLRKSKINHPLEQEPTTFLGIDIKDIKNQKARIQELEKKLDIATKALLEFGTDFEACKFRRCYRQNCTGYCRKICKHCGKVKK